MLEATAQRRREALGVTGDTTRQPALRVRKITLPWLSMIGGLLAVGFFLVRGEPRLLMFYELPPVLLQAEAAYAALGLLVLLVLVDLRRYRRQHSDQAQDLERLHSQLDELWARNRQLQLKAHTYSDHADKLKLFISDKLLDYIEYDEKFLHFKGIAAEVRHNGVISFDKVQSALQQGLVEAEGQSESVADEERAAQYRTALDAMRYLWDLLDLSTADNLTLHIGNLLCECEEHYCQRLLNPDQPVALPYEPTYSPRRAAWRALGMIGQDVAAEPEGASPWYLQARELYACLEPAGELLGNENHLVLLLENLLRNAQFYAGKRGYSSPFPSIALTLAESRGDVCIRVYNRGPHIRDEDRERLFQLGYSTRRKREHHGRGLGLYFVNEIVKAYEGSILVDNIHTPALTYEVILELDNGAIISDRVRVDMEEGRPRGVLTAGGEPVWELPARLVQASVSAGDEAPCARLDDFAQRGRQDHHDPLHPTRPQWRLRHQPKRGGGRVVFEPLAVQGVEFEVRLPTAQKRLDGIDDAVADAAALDADEALLRSRVVTAPDA